MSKEEKEVNPREVELSDGRKVIVNMNGLTWQDVREYVRGVPVFDPDNPEASAEPERRHAELKGKACGLSADEVLALGYEDFARVSRKISDLIANPVSADPS